MTRIPNARSRPYRSELRAEQAEATRARIIDAAIRVMAGGIATLSIPDVAREAGVSVPTIYRHFGTKRDLVDAIYPHLASRAGIGRIDAPRSVEEFREMVRNVFGRLESLGEVARAAMSSPASDEARRRQMPARQALSRQFVATVMPHASATEQERLSRVLLVLTSSAGMRMWRDQQGVSVDTAADDIHWLIRTVLSATERGTSP
jgi:AcrR family transcriptional regulator